MTKGKLDSQVSKILVELAEEAEGLGINRINSTMLLKGLLENVESPLYEAIMLQIGDTIFFPDLLEETYLYFPEPENKQNKAEEESKTLPQIILVQNNEEDKTIFFDEDLRQVWEFIGTYLAEGQDVAISDLTFFLLYSMPLDVLKVLRTFGISTFVLRRMFGIETEEEYSEEEQTSEKEQNCKEFELPDEFKGFVKNLNEAFKGKTCDILGRDKECKLIWQTMQKKTKKNVVLIGEPGVGKTAIVEKITHDIISGNCPKDFENYTVLSLDVTSSVAGTMYRGQAEKRYSDFANFLERQPNIIVFIDEIHLIRGAGASKEGEIDLANALKPILAGENATVIGATTIEEYEKYFSRDGAIKRRFRPIEVKEPKMRNVGMFLKKSIETLSKYHGILISKEMVDFIIVNAACFNNETREPDRTKDLIDLSMVVAKQAGKTEVDKESVLANFEYNFEKFAKMSDYAKRSTAYHEAGHCLVAMKAGTLNDYSVIAVSIMPTDTYLGVTVYEENEDIVEPSMDYYVDNLAFNLAGRVAEKMFTNTVTSGARADLANATRIAYNIVAKYGMVEEFGMNRIYTEEIKSEEINNQINREIDKLIAKAMKRAEEILTKNSTFLEMLVEALMEKGIVGPEELEHLLKNIKQN